MQFAQQEGQRRPHIVGFLQLHSLRPVIGRRIQVKILAVADEQLTLGLGVIPSHFARLAQLEPSPLRAMRFALPRILFLKNDFERLRVVIPGLHGGQQIAQLRIGGKSRHRQQSRP